MSTSRSSRLSQRRRLGGPGHRPAAPEAGARSTGVGTFLQAVQDFGGGGGRSANSQYQYTLLGDDLTELRTWSQKMRVALQDVPEITDVDTDLQPGGLEADLIVDRDSASRLGLTEIQIDNALGDAFAQAQVSTIYNPFSPQQYHVVMEVAPEFWQNPDVLKKLYVSTSGGAVSGTQATQAVAGTTVLKGAAPSASAQRRSPRTPRAIWPPIRWPMPAAATPRPARR